MKLPNRKQVFIPNKKLTNYLLSDTHPTGKLKAKFYKSVGFNLSNIEKLKTELWSIAVNGQIEKVTITPFGKKYIIDGKIISPRRKLIKMRTIWIIEKERKRPRFITAYPV